MAVAGSNDSGSYRPHVLVVEPDLGVQQLFRTALEQLGVSVTVAGNGGAARAVIDATMVDFAYIAVLLGDEGGVDIARYATGRGTHVVLMSGHSDGIEEGLKAGYPFLQKPFRLTDMFRPLVLRLPAWQHHVVEQA
jgi:DNA-binding response OmpR family regulator